MYTYLSAAEQQSSLVTSTTTNSGIPQRSLSSSHNDLDLDTSVGDPSSVNTRLADGQKYTSATSACSRDTPTTSTANTTATITATTTTVEVSCSVNLQETHENKQEVNRSRGHDRNDNLNLDNDDVISNDSLSTIVNINTEYIREENRVDCSSVSNESFMDILEANQSQVSDDSDLMIPTEEEDEEEERHRKVKVTSDESRDLQCDLETVARSREAELYVEHLVDFIKDLANKRRRKFMIKHQLIRLYTRRSSRVVNEHVSLGQ